MFGRQILSRSQQLIAAISALLMLCAVNAQAQNSAFAYQGRLTDSGTSASGLYDFEFRLFSDAGVQIGPALSHEDVQVVNGVFTVTLDFGAQAFDGSARALEIAVRLGVSTDAFTLLAPRQPVTSSPYALRTLSAAQADSATTTEDAQKLGGVVAGQYVKTDDPRLAGGGLPSPGSPNYIQNGTTQQAASNFNISGNGSAAGTLSGSIVSAATQFNIGSNRVLRATPQFTSVGVGAGAPGGVAGNSFFGASAGASTAAGANSFFGASAGKITTSGDANSFFGSSAALRNTTGKSNTFLGASAGNNNSTGNFNTFVGKDAGKSNTEETHNTFLGFNANAVAGVVHATAVGANAKVETSGALVLGTDTVFVGIGTSAPKARLHVENGNIYLSGAGKGIVFKSQNGLFCRVMFLTNTGTIQVVTVPCL